MPLLPRLPVLSAAAALAFGGVAPLRAAAASAEDIAFFESRIRPVLVAECSQCHAADKTKGGLRLDWRGGWEKGGESGPAIIPGNAEGSLLYQSVARTHAELKMPKDGAPFDSRTLADFRTWIEKGAADSRDREPSLENTAPRSWEEVLAYRKLWWSFQPVSKADPPPVKDAAWPQNPVDRFLLSEMEARGLHPAAPAEPAALYRRLCFALTGLPPAPEDTAAFVRDFSPAVIDAAITRLMDSPHFGERWARHWMDLMRYADTHGSEGDPEIPQAWRYRDYLVRAFNADVPLDQLIREHIAGDLLPDPRLNAALGINESAIGPAQFRLMEHGFQPVDTLDEQVRTIDNQIDVVSKSFLGVTLSCARCHDHKFDPLSQRDYYALYGVFASCRPGMVTVSDPQPNAAILKSLAEAKADVKRALADVWLEASKKLAAALQETPDESLTNAAAEAAQLAWKARGQRGPAPLSAWDFSTGMNDVLTEWPAVLESGARLEKGRLILDGKSAFARTAPLVSPLHARTLEAWVGLSTLDQQGGGVVSVESADGRYFDSIVFAEEEPRRWLAGSDYHRRSRSLGGPEETARPDELVHLVVSWHPDGTIEAWRNGRLCGQRYRPEGEETSCRVYEAGSSRLLFGKRHTGGGNANLQGEIASVRVYDSALTAGQIQERFAAGPGPLPALNETRLTAAERERFATVKKLVAQSRSQPARKVKSPAEDVQHPLYLREKMQRVSDAGFRSAWQNEMAALRKEEEARVQAWTTARGVEGFREMDLAGWRRAGTGLPDASPAPPGGFSVKSSGEDVIERLLPAGWWTHSASTHCNGVLTSPRFKIGTDFISVRCAGGGGAQVRVIVDGYPLGNNSIFPKASLKEPAPRWVKLDTAYRKGSWAYLEFTTLDDAARSEGDGGSNPERRSFFGVERVVFHNAPDLPPDPLLAPRLFLDQPVPQNLAELAGLIAAVTTQAVQAWQHEQADAVQTAWLDALIRSGLLPVSVVETQTLKQSVSRWREIEASLKSLVRVPGLLEGDVIDQALYVRGDHKKPGEIVPRGFPGVLPGGVYSPDQSGRLQLAADILRPDNPLTARVMANRIWHHLFGRGLVPTVDNFGRLGEQPAHPALLDWLAVRLREDGWSLKRTIRLLVTSRAWQMSSAPSSAAAEHDPDNRWLSHFRVRRLEAEAIRDSLLLLSGKLDPSLSGPPVPLRDDKRRSLYVNASRVAPHPFLEVFDAAKPLSTQGRRDQTNVPAQSLTMLNDPFVIGCAKAWAERLERDARGAAADKFASRVLASAWGRAATPEETSRAVSHLRSLAAERGAGDDDLAVRADFIQSVMNTKEFIWLK